MVRVPVQKLDRDPHFRPILRVPCKFLDRDPQWGEVRGRVEGRREKEKGKGKGKGKGTGVLAMWGKLRTFAMAMCRDEAAIAERIY